MCLGEEEVEGREERIMRGREGGKDRGKEARKKEGSKPCLFLSSVASLLSPTRGRRLCQSVGTSA